MTTVPCAIAYTVQLLQANLMLPQTPVLKAQLVIIDDDIVRYRVYCDQCDDWHYHGPRDGHRECHCTNPDSLYHRGGYFIRLDVSTDNVAVESVHTS